MAKIKFNPDDLTVGDLEDLEEITGQPVGDLMGLLSELESGGMKTLSAKLITGLVFIVTRHGDPDFTLEGARKVRLSELELDLSTGPPDPTPPAG